MCCCWTGIAPPPQLMMAEVRGRKLRHGVFRNFLFLFLFLLSLPPIIYYILYIIYPIHRSEIPGTEHAKRNIILIKNDSLKTVHLFFWQLFMVPGLREEILSVRIPCRKLEDFPRELVGRRVSLPQDEAAVQVLQQVQRTFLHLRDGKLRSFDPVRLVDACTCLDLNFPVNEQNDASEFCDKLLDRVESGMKVAQLAIESEMEMARGKTEAGEAGGMVLRSESGIGGSGKPRAAALNRFFGGTLAYEKIPTGCLHRTNRSEPFTNVEVVISGKESLEESLASSVESELMTGDNKVGETTRENERVSGSRFGSVGFGFVRIGSLLFSWF